MYAGGVNFTFLLFMNVYHIYLFILSCQKEGKDFLKFCFCPFVDDWQKGENDFDICMFLFYTRRGRRNLENLLMLVYLQLVSYMHVYFSIGIRAHMFSLCKKGRSILHLCIYVLFGLCIHWISLLFIAMHELRGSFYEA